MIVISSVNISHLFKKAIETILDGSEQAMITFDEKGLQIQSVDSLSVCMCLFKFSKKRFFKFEVSKTVQIKFNTRPLYNFIKKFPGVAFSFICKKNVLWIKVVSGFGKIYNTVNEYKFVNIKDRTDYFSIPEYTFINCPSFRLDTEEFTNIILDLAVGGGYIQVEMEGCRILWKTCFETGSISVESHNANNIDKGYMVLIPAHTKISNKYLTKFFKQACNIAPTCDNLTIYMRAGGPIVLEFELGKGLSSLIISIVPVITQT